MSRGKKRRKSREVATRDPLKIGAELGFTPAQLADIEAEYGKAGLHTVIQCSTNAITGDFSLEYVIGQLETYGVEALKDMFPNPGRGAYNYQERHDEALAMITYESIIDMSGWAPLKSEESSVDGNGQVVHRDEYFGLIVALDGEYGRGVIIASGSRAPFEIMDPSDPRRRRLPEDDEEPPPYGWRIGMFEGDRVNKIAVTPIMVVADEVGASVRKIKDSLDWALVQTAFVCRGDWQEFPGEFPEVGAPDLSLVEDADVRKRLEIGLSRDGFLTTSPKKGRPAAFSAAVRQRLGL